MFQHCHSDHQRKRIPINQLVSWVGNSYPSLFWQKKLSIYLRSVRSNLIGSKEVFCHVAEACTRACVPTFVVHLSESPHHFCPIEMRRQCKLSPGFKRKVNRKETEVEVTILTSSLFFSGTYRKNCILLYHKILGFSLSLSHSHSLTHSHSHKRKLET